MSFFSKLFDRENPNIIMQPLYAAIVAEGRRLEWYVAGGVPDTLDGRFDMIAAIFSLVQIRLEQEKDTEQNIAWLVEHFVDDMDGQIRQIGINDVVVGKHIGKMMGALGGRLVAYRDALLANGNLEQALSRNIYRGEPVEQNSLEFTTRKLSEFYDALTASDINTIMAGNLPRAAQ